MAVVPQLCVARRRSGTGSFPRRSAEVTCQSAEPLSQKRFLLGAGVLPGGLEWRAGVGAFCWEPGAGGAVGPFASPGSGGTTGRDTRSRELQGRQAPSQPVPLADTTISKKNLLSFIGQPERECPPIRGGPLAALSPTQAFEVPYSIGCQGCLSRRQLSYWTAGPGHVERALLCVCMCRKQAELAVLLPLASRFSRGRGLS